MSPHKEPQHNSAQLVMLHSTDSEVGLTALKSGIRVVSKSRGLLQEVTDLASPFAPHMEDFATRDYVGITGLRILKIIKRFWSYFLYGIKTTDFFSPTFEVFVEAYPDIPISTIGRLSCCRINDAGRFDFFYQCWVWFDPRFR